MKRLDITISGKDLQAACNLQVRFFPSCKGENGYNVIGFRDGVLTIEYDEQQYDKSAFTKPTLVAYTGGNGLVIYNPEEWFVCHKCGQLHSKEVIRKVYVVENGNKLEYWCAHCAESNAHQCVECGNYFTHVLYTHDDDPVCYDCCEEYYFTCDRCENIFHIDSRMFIDDEYVCPDCYEVMGGGVIREYHDNPTRYYHRTEQDDPYTSLFIGTELETEFGNKEDRIAITNYHGDNERFIYQMHDGSLGEDGIECITQPMTKAFFDQFKFEDWLDELKEAGTRSHDTKNCGLHVHLSHEWFGSNEELQETMAGIVTDIMNELMPQLDKFARRKCHQWCAYPCDDNFPADKKVALENARKQMEHSDYKKEIKKAGKYSDRYVCLNTNNTATFEFRIFRGTLHAETYRASVELCLRLVAYAKHKNEQGNVRYSWEQFLTFAPLPEVLRAAIDRLVSNQ